jgi:23S rRNA (adenine1618-N6)-methyltransferase
MVTQGGEVAFVSRIISESLQLRDAVQWYSSMFGKASSVTIIIERLMEAGNTNWAVAEFVQGNKTRRWAVAWSWEDLRPSMVSCALPLFIAKRAILLNRSHWPALWKR